MDTTISILVKLTVQLVLLPVYIFIVWSISTFLDIDWQLVAMFYLGTVVADVFRPFEDNVLAPCVRRHKERLFNASK